jgi:hypothetical protein
MAQLHSYRSASINAFFGQAQNLNLAGYQGRSPCLVSRHVLLSAPRRFCRLVGQVENLRAGWQPAPSRTRLTVRIPFPAAAVPRDVWLRLCRPVGQVPDLPLEFLHFIGSRMFRGAGFRAGYARFHAGIFCSTGIHQKIILSATYRVRDRLA